MPGASLVYVARKKLRHACIETCIRQEPLGVARGPAWVSRAPSLGRQAPLLGAPGPASVPEEGLRMFWHVRGLRSTLKHAGLWAVFGSALIVLFSASLRELVGEVVGALSSWSASQELQKACEEVCLAGLVCVPTMRVFFALRARQACLFSEARFKEQVSAAHRLPQTSAAQTDCRLA